MAFSTQREVSDGTLVDVRLQIEFIDRADIYIFVNEEPKYVGQDWDWVTDTLLQMREPVPTGQELLVRRFTNLSKVLNVFVLGATFDDPTMDENFRQALFIAQEAREGATLEVFTNLDMHGYRLRNLGNPFDPEDAVNLRTLLDRVSREAAIRASSDALLQAQISGGATLTASAFSPISWHDQVISGSVNIPANKNAWSFGPVVSIADGQVITVGSGSYWTIANGEVNQ